MKRIILLLMVTLLLLTACGEHHKNEKTEMEASWSGKLEGTVLQGTGNEWSYQLTTKNTQRAHWDKKDHRILASCMYEIPRMKITGGANEKNRDEVHPAHAVVQRFNDTFEQWLQQRQKNFTEIADMAEEDYKDHTHDEAWSEKNYRYSDRVSASFWNNHHLACVTMRTASFTGGAHEIVGQESYTFDLKQGKMVDINDMVLDYNSLRDVVAEEILSQTMDEQESKDDRDNSFFSDYEKVIPEWMSRNVFFGPQSLTVVFDVYDIAPSSAGEQAFDIPYEMIKPYLNDYGKEVLELE